MSLAFTWQASAARVTLRRGAIGCVADEVDRLQGRRVLLIGGGPPVAGSLATLRERLGDRVSEVIEDAQQHVPADTANSACDIAQESRADIVVTLGGGSATGLGKAVAVGCDLPLVAVPTTYAGSEMTPVWGRTESGRKVTDRDERALPRSVIYDTELYSGMPPRLAAASGMNALAHCLEALWLPATSPMTGALAELGIRQLLSGLPRVVADPGDVDGHAETLVGACLAGVAFAQAGSGLHHRTCHVLGGGWNLPHAETHAVVLPHSTALVTARRSDLADRLSVLLDGDPSQRVFALLTEYDLPHSLAELGMPASALEDAALRVLEALRDDPIADATGIRELLEGAQGGRLPAPTRKAPTNGRVAATKENAGGGR